MNSKRGRIAFWSGLLITAGFVVIAFYSYDFDAVIDALRGANYWWVIPAALVEMAAIYIRAARWRHFLEPIKEVSLYNTTMTTFVGFAANVLAPARLGELIRAWLLGKREKISKSAVMGTVVIERAVDGLAMVVVVALVLALVEVPAGQSAYWETLKSAGYVCGFLFIMLFAMLYLMYRRVAWVEWLITKTISLLPERFHDRVRHLLESFRQGFDVLDHSHHVIAIIFWSILFWLVSGGLNLAYFHAFGLGDLPLIATYLVLIAQAVGVLIPSPGFVGPYHAATIAALVFYGVDNEQALSMAIVMHAVMFITNAVPGIIFLAHEKLSFEQVKHSTEEAEEHEEL